MATASIGVRERMAAASKRIARVKLVDRGATGVITLGGLFIILSVLFIFVFIFAEAVPLFRGAKGERLGKISLAGVRGATPHGTPPAFGADEYQKYLYEITPDAHLVVFRLADGAPHREMPLPGVEGTAITSASRALAGDSLAAGTADGPATTDACQTDHRVTPMPSRCQWRCGRLPASASWRVPRANIWSVMRYARSTRQRAGRCARCGESAALYMRKRRLTMNVATSVTATGDWAATSCATTSWAMPEKARNESAMPCSGVIPAPTAATPATNPNGTVPTSTGAMARQPAMNSLRAFGNMGRAAILPPKP